MEELLYHLVMVPFPGTGIKPMRQICRAENVFAIADHVEETLKVLEALAPEIDTRPGALVGCLFLPIYSRLGSGLVAFEEERALVGNFFADCGICLAIHDLGLEATWERFKLGGPEEYPNRIRSLDHGT